MTEEIAGFQTSPKAQVQVAFEEIARRSMHDLSFLHPSMPVYVSDFTLFLCASCDRFFIFQLNFFEKAREGWLFPPENAILFCRMVVLSCAAYAGFMMISEG